MLDQRFLSECSFQPQLNKNIPDFNRNKLADVNGTLEYLQQRERARKAKRDKEEREKKVFLNGDNWSRNNLVTIPKPFKLSYTNIKKNEQEAKRERDEYEMKECTFKPKTNEA